MATQHLGQLWTSTDSDSRTDNFSGLAACGLARSLQFENQGLGVVVVVLLSITAPPSGPKASSGRGSVLNDGLQRTVQVVVVKAVQYYEEPAMSVPKLVNSHIETLP